MVKKKVLSEERTDRDSKQEVDSTMPLDRDGGHYEGVLPKRKRKRKQAAPTRIHHLVPDGDSCRRGRRLDRQNNTVQHKRKAEGAV